MYSIDLTKPDGRSMTLYSLRPIGAHEPAPSPSAESIGANPHLRWHPLRGEWVAYAAFRQNRPFLPPPQYNPLAVSTDPANPTELPVGDYEVAVFDNRFPSLALDSHEPPELAVATAPAAGKCEVVVFTQDPTASLYSLSVSRIDLLMQVWADRTTRAAATGTIKYVLPFENRGAEVGVTLHHPHGQMYCYPFVPPVPQKMLDRELAFFRETGTNLLVQMAKTELEEGSRVIYSNEHAVAFVPPCARYPYEVWVMPIRHAPSFAALEEAQRRGLAQAVKAVLLKYEGLWSRPFPYLMAWYQAPTDGQPHPETQLHAEFYPPYRTRERLKYLAGTEIGAGMFAMDVLPEEKAKDLQNVAIELEE
ncbi:galactose-1-phosphate uridylyltransferase [Massilia sp. PAMC28688]|uniref:galactose-1-phosphate uridylyltransferase n=1 Tax=Massilia sp. PAMC28688 TaxID=2861283 RepID=UPI001C638CFB|nr:galactose-1-phosphate uridylyltransferase [Massilia sp. PAMC28688]QYF93689.1 galactose-1-phosphate uridylyltransferase [Massilia sp. PAMC28688]